MKVFSFFLSAVLLSTLPIPAQDAAVEERLNKLSAQIQDLVEAREALNKRIDELARVVRELQDQANKPSVVYATPEDLRRLADSVKEVDRKRMEDNERILTEIEKLGHKFVAAQRQSKQPANVSSGGGSAKPEKGFEYSIQQGDSLTAIAKAYTDQGYKVTVDQILKANPGLIPEKMRLGQKIFIPAP